jgi:hypothetical protein|tara:strand:- start:2289 stop:2546 length:258 start_codon:yes stop_codon:yes gene_type:complete
LSNQRKLEGGIEEARDLVQSKAKDFAKKAAIGSVLYAADQLPGSEKVKDFFKPKYKEITEKIPKGLSVDIDPVEQKVTVGFKIKF